jgi:hypothetical protein
MGAGISPRDFTLEMDRSGQICPGHPEVPYCLAA